MIRFVAIFIIAFVITSLALWMNFIYAKKQKKPHELFPEIIEWRKGDVIIQTEINKVIDDCNTFSFEHINEDGTVFLKDYAGSKIYTVSFDKIEKYCFLNSRIECEGRTFNKDDGHYFDMIKELRKLKSNV